MAGSLRNLLAGMAVVVACTTGAFALPAAAQGTGTISGTVTDATTGPVGGLTIEARHWFWGVVLATTTTAPDGSFTLHVPPGSYRLRATDPSGARPDWWSGNTAAWATSSALEVLADTTTTVDLTYPAADTIAGTVTDPSANPLGGITVELLDAGNWPIASATTAPDGTYQFDGLVGGPFALRFSAPGTGWATQYFGPAAALPGATRITTVGATTHVADHTMVQAGSLHGTVTIGADPPAIDAAGIPSPAGLVALVLTPDVLALAGAAFVGADGSWDAEGVPPGDYKVAIIDLAWLGPNPSSGYRPVLLPDGDVASDMNGAWAAATRWTVPSGGTTWTGSQAVVGWDCSPDLGPNQDLADRDLAGANLRGCDLHGSTFSSPTVAANLSGADLRNADLSGASFVTITTTVVFFMAPSGVAITDPPQGTTMADLTGARLSGADLGGALISSGWQLAEADHNWSGISFTGAREPYLQVYCSFGCSYGVWSTSVSLFQVGIYRPATNAPWNGAPLGLGTLGPDLRLTGAQLPTSAQIGDLHGLDLSGAVLERAAFVGGNLSNTLLVGTSLLSAFGTVTGGSTAVYGGTTCPDGVITDGTTVTSCVGHGLAP